MKHTRNEGVMNIYRSSPPTVERLNNYGDFHGFKSHMCGCTGRISHMITVPRWQTDQIFEAYTVHDMADWFPVFFFIVKLVFSSGRKSRGACVPAFSLILCLPPKALQIMSLCSRWFQLWLACRGTREA